MIIIVNRIDINVRQARKRRIYRWGQLQYNLEKIRVTKPTSGLSIVYSTMDLILEAAQQHNKNQNIIPLQKQTSFRKQR